MTKKRFHKAYCCGDTGVVDKLENEWFIENINSISDIEKNWDNVIDKLNQVAEENEKLKCKVTGLKSELSIWKEDANEHIKEINKLFEENKQLKKELFESNKNYLIETYSDNPTRRDEKIQLLKEEFKKW